jgi:hypothetical protein
MEQALDDCWDQPLDFFAAFGEHEVVAGCPVGVTDGARGFGC